MPIPPKVVGAFGDMTTALKNFLKTGDSAAADTAAVALKQEARQAAAAAARTNDGAAAAAARQAQSDPAALLRNTRAASDEAQAGENLVKGANAKNGEAANLDAAGNPKTAAELVDAGKTKLSILGVDITATRVIGFATFATLVTLMAIYFTATANKTITIKNIEYADATHINITYEKPSDEFTLRVNDELEFLAVTPAPTAPPLAGTTRKITAIISDTTVQITLPGPLTSIAGAGYNTPVAGTPAGPPAWATSWGTAKAHTTLENQFFGAVRDGVAFVAGAAAAAVGGAVPGVNEIVDDLGDVLGNAGNALRGALCETLPFLCNTTMWFIVGGVILGLIVLLLILPALSGGGEKNTASK